ncbi:SMI1/KNR4 family protein [Singulisphaera sp. Ch08]|uniref:SMI1/KNR4 family protein n=1 Tax=Singulisphaera sp. Ch08 TaxID=3120278 RepID=A0AAU7CIS8_9BACT
MDFPEEFDETEIVTHFLITAPIRWGPDDAGLLWNEVLPNGEVEIRFWTPDNDADRARLEAFWQACQQVDWDDVRVHEVPATEIKRPAFTMPVAAPAPPPKAGPAPEFTEQGLIRRVPHAPAPVAESWHRIEAWMSRHCPEVIAALLPGASETEIAEFEAVIGQKLPADVRESYRIHDGLGPIPMEYYERFEDDEDINASSPEFIHSLFYEMGLHSICGRRGREAILSNWADRGGSELIYHEYSECEVFPADAIQIRDDCRGWIPLFCSDGNCFGVDLAPGPTGVVGQVINFGNDENEFKFVLATSWAQFLEDYADELEAGNFVITGEPSDYDRELLMKRPRESPICGNWRHWAEAKLSPAFQAIATAPSSEPVPAAPETDRECRAVVEGFLSAYRAWELRWLAVRPVGQLGFHSVLERADGVFRWHAYTKKDLIQRGLPVPAAVTYVETIERSGKSYSEIQEDAWLKAHLDVGPHYQPAMAERRAIFAAHTTDWAQRSQSDAFVLHDSPRFDLEEYRDALVYQCDDDTAYVWSIRGNADRRFLLKREQGAWRIERLQAQFKDNQPFRSKTLM